MFGNLGFPHFDRERKAYMAFALTVTLVAIVVTGFGCFALNADPHTLRFTAWGVSHTRFFVSEDDAEERVGQISYIGLRRFVVNHQCSRNLDDEWTEWSGCDRTIVWWVDAQCAHGETSYFSFPCAAMETCQDAAINNQVGAYMTCVTLIFAIIGCLTRMRRVADT